MTKGNILLVEDDQEIARLVAMYLEAEGFNVAVIDNGTEALAAIQLQNPDLVVLDLMLPGLSGIEVCKRARKFYTGAIMVLTACDDDVSEVSLLKLGADDFMGKPLRPHVLTARIDALLRRHRPMPKSQFEVCRHSQRVQFRGQPLTLTESEYQMLTLLIENIGDVVSRTQCCRSLRGIDYDLCDRSIDMRISALRKKLGDNRAPYQTIITVRNQGYKLINADT
ncbi:response regulator transcription factor [Ferrimonas aestuarii]|uniref:Response regulator transcription factor n=1 Tax=Ferrimonas aestuarii TaxID=2569539 RepID=A0A4U1BQQ3_9GAMM|nr:response regulator transcription factor [Ferrimonas aestuarii]TKB55020.1 response regulator transcription factor [Ferrimonas aestuarii]